MEIWDLLRRINLNFLSFSLLLMNSQSLLQVRIYRWILMILGMDITKSVQYFYQFAMPISPNSHKFYYSFYYSNYFAQFFKVHEFSFNPSKKVSDDGLSIIVIILDYAQVLCCYHIAYDSPQQTCVILLVLFCCCCC